MERGYSPSECLDAQTHCVCYSPKALKRIAEVVRANTDCQLELEEYKRFQQNEMQPMQQAAWYQEPSFIVGGVVLSLGVGVMLGLMMTR